MWVLTQFSTQRSTPILIYTSGHNDFTSTNIFVDNKTYQIFFQGRVVLQRKTGFIIAQYFQLIETLSNNLKDYSS